MRWTTASEIDNVGFRVIRGALGGPGRGKSSLDVVTPMVIPAQGTNLGGAKYSVRDVGVDTTKRVFYFLQDIDVEGAVTRHGPVWLEPIERFEPVQRGRRAAH